MEFTGKTGREVPGVLENSSAPEGSTRFGGEGTGVGGDVAAERVSAMS
jgi:hypothetical protein